MSGYQVAEVFYSLQGEGARAGVPSVFVRFAGCNVHCGLHTHGFNCDTELTDGVAMTAGQIVDRVMDSTSRNCRSVILTGGEPGLQVDVELIAALKGAGFYLAIETNGTCKLPNGLDWICISPKVPDRKVAQRTASEVKYVLGAGSPIPRTTIRADHYLISPAWAGHNLPVVNLRWCIDLVKQHPRWRLSVQQHKLWCVR